MKRPPSSLLPFSHAARSVSSVDASSLHFMSAILAWVIWNAPIGWPNALRSRDVGQRRLVRGARDADRLRGDADAAGVEHAHRDLEAVAFLAQHVFGRADVVGELDLAGRRGADAELGFGLAAMEARRDRYRS